MRECHDDPYRSWAQTEHWGLAAFFGKVNGDFGKVAEPRTPASPNAAQIVIPRSAFKNAGTNVPAAFLGGREFRPSREDMLRAALADWVTAKDNPFFARAFANRLWFYFFARGLVHPVDDFRELNPPSHPGLMKLLANEFAASGFDVKHLIRCLCNAAAYQRTSRLPPGTDEQATAALTALFGRMPLRVMTADVLYDSLKLAYGDPRLDLRGFDPKDGIGNGESAPVADAYLEFLRRFGTNEEDATDFTHGIPQLPTMINHPRPLAGSKALDAYLKANPAATPEQTVEWLYLSTLSRRRSDAEQADAQRYLKKTADPARGYCGVLWMLVNRTEYLLIRYPLKGLENLKEAGSDLDDRLEMLAASEGRFAQEYALPAVGAKQAAFQRAVRLMRSRRAKAFNLDEEPDSIRDAYGRDKFGQSCLLARRLIEAGVSFVEVFRRGWDDHGVAAKNISARTPWLDAGMSTLIRDLKQRGLLDDTLIVWMGEFGRTPGNGEGHFCNAWSTVWAGGGIRTGRVIGKTSETGKNPGSTIEERPISAPDYIATLCLALGIDTHQEFIGPGGRPMPLVEKTAEPIKELLK